MRLRTVGKILAGAAAVYVVAAACLYAAMRQPPERFGAIMSHVPMPAMMILPFRRSGCTRAQARCGWEMRLPIFGCLRSTGAGR